MGLSSLAAAEHGVRAYTDASTTPKDRQQVEPSRQLDDKKSKFLAEAFGQPEAVSAIKQKFGHIPEALANARSGDESGIASIVAELGRTIWCEEGEAHCPKLENLINTAEKEWKKAKSEDSPDREYLALVARVYKAGKTMDGKSKATDEISLETDKVISDPAKFSALFKKAFDDLGKDGLIAEAQRKFDLAANNPPAKQWLRDHLNRDGFLSWAKNNGEYGAKWLERVAWANDAGTNFYVDLKRGNEFIRLSGATPEALTDAFNKFTKDAHALDGASLAQHAHPDNVPLREFFVSEGKLTERPRPGSQAAAATAIAGTIAGAAAGAAGPAGVVTAATTASAAGAANAAAFKAIINQACGRCHSGPTPRAGVTVDQIASSAKAARAADLIAGSAMPPGNPGFKDTDNGRKLIAWLRTL
jgi:hypothetical protein